MYNKHTRFIVLIQLKQNINTRKIQFEQFFLCKQPALTSFHIQIIILLKTHGKVVKFLSKYIKMNPEHIPHILSSIFCLLEKVGILYTRRTSLISSVTVNTQLGLIRFSTWKIQSQGHKYVSSAYF